PPPFFFHRFFTANAVQELQAILVPDPRRLSHRGSAMPTVNELTVNGKKCSVEADAQRSLLSVLRDDLDLTGCKYGCGEGKCGACTVLVDGRPIRSCNTEVGDAAGKPIRTIESLADKDKLHPLQQAFLDAGALQCGYCTPGMLMSALALLTRK